MVIDPGLERTIRDAAHDYERALVDGDVDRATAWFAARVGSDGTVTDRGVPVSRFGPDGEQFGATEVARARAAQSPADAPVWLHESVVPIADDAALHLAVIRRGARRVQRTQLWCLGDAGWRIVHAHVSSIPMGVA